jgi:hypothetical protein
MGPSGEGIILEAGVDLDPVEQAGQVIKKLLADLNAFSDQFHAKASAQRAGEVSGLKAEAAAAVQAAMAGLIEEEKKQAVLRTQTAEFARQAAAQQAATAATQANIAAQQLKLQIIRSQNAALASQGGGMGGAISPARMFMGIGQAAGGGIGAAVLGGLAGGGIALMFNEAIHSLEHFISKIKQAVDESGKFVIVREQFEAFARGAGVDAAKMMENLTDKTEGLVDKMTLIKTANAAFKSGLHLSADEVANLTGNVAKLAEAAGSTAEQGVQRLNMSLSRGRPVALSTVLQMQQIRDVMRDIPPGLDAAGRRTLEWHRVLKLLNDEAGKVGELPQTFEQASARIKNATKNLLLSFGAGLTESGGSQVFLGVLKGETKAFNDLQDTAEKAGRVVGEIFAGLSPIFTVLRQVISGITAVLGSVFDAISKVFRVPIEKGEGAKGAIKDIGIAILLVGTGLEFCYRFIELIITALGNLAPIAEDIVALFYNIMKGDVGGAMAALGRVKAGFGELAKGARDSASDIEKVFADSALGLIQFGYKVDKAFADIGKKKRPRLPAEDTQSDTYKSQVQELEAEKKLLELWVQHQKALDTLRQAMAKIQLQQKQQQIAAEKELDNEHYADGEESLHQHLLNQAALVRQSDTAQREEQAEVLRAQIRELDIRQTKVIEEGRVKAAERVLKSGPQTERDVANIHQDTQEQLLTIGTERVKAYVSNGAAIVKIQGDTAKQLQKIDREEVADRDAAAKKAIESELALTKEGLAAKSRLLEQVYRNDSISAAEYNARKLESIQEEADAEIAAAYKVYEASKKNAVDLEVMQDKVRKALQGAGEKIEATGPVEKVIQQFERVFGLREKVAAGAAAYAGRTGGAQEQAVAIANQLEIARQKESAAKAMLGVEGLTPDEFLKLTESVESADAQVRKFGEELQKLTDKMSFMGQLMEGLSVIGAAIGQVFHSKFAQNLAQEVQGGATALQKDKERGKVLNDPTASFADKLAAAVGAIGDFISALTSAKSTISGVLGGGMQGAGLGGAIGGMFGPMGTAIGTAAGAVFGSVLGGVVGHKNAEVQANITANMNKFNTTMTDFSMNSANLQLTIQSLQQMVSDIRAEQASSKKGSAQYQQQIDQFNTQIKQLQIQQKQILVDMGQQLSALQAGAASATVSAGLQGTLSTLQQIILQYNKYVGAIQPGINATQQLAQANDYLTQSLQNAGLTLENQLLGDNQQAIQDALSLNDLLQQRVQLINQINQQIAGVLSAGVLTRQATRAQTAGMQIEQIQVSATQQLAKMNEEITVSQFKVDAETKIFGLATTRIGLENQLVIVQEKQANRQMQVIAANLALLQAMQAGNVNYGPLAALIAAIQPVTNPVAGGDLTSLLEQLFGAAFADRGSLGYGGFAGQNL